MNMAYHYGDKTMIPKRFPSALLLIVFAALSMCADAQDKPSEYRLGDGDNIRISVFENPNLTLETRISESGMITFPLIKTAKIGGMTIAAAEKTIATALNDGGFIRQAQVSILVLKNLGNQVSVLGFVGKPGRFPLETFNTRLSEMVAMAGGVALGGADVAIVTGMRDGKPFRKQINIAGMFLDKKLEDDLVVAGGDVIYIDRQPVFYIYGEVQRPGSFRIERNMTVRQALVQGGGVTARGTERGLVVHRRDADGKLKDTSVNLNDPVQPDDVLEVGESLF